jgi:glycosyltransferase involved in cell wall biosynthesis
MLVENRFPADSRVHDEAFTLKDSGVQVSVIALRGRGERFHEVVNGVPVYRIPALTLFKKLPEGGSSQIKRLVRNVQCVSGYLVEYGYFTTGCLLLSLYVSVRHGFDVVHAHNPPDTLFVVAMVHKIFGKKFVFDHHDLSPELYLSRYTNSANGLVVRALHAFERCSVRLASVVISTNSSYRDIVIRRHAIDPDSVFIVRNGPDSKRVKLVEPDSRLRGMNKIILGFVGDMNPQDGVDYLLRAAHYLLCEMKRTDFYCVIIGDGDSREELELLSKTLGLEDHVWFTGFISDEDLMRYLSTTDICLDPNPSNPLNDVSTWIKVMEYMALGKPIVSFDLKETRTSAGDAAVYVPPNDEAAFARAIASLMDDSGRRTRMGEVGRARVRDELSWSITSQNLLKAYARVFQMDSSVKGDPCRAAVVPSKPSQVARL